MAFCKFCGKQIPEGGSCDCAGAKGEAEVKETVENGANNIQEKAENAVETVKNEAAEALTNAKEKAENAVEGVKDGAEKVADKVENGAKQAGSDIAKKVDNIAGGISENLPGGMKNNKSAVYIAAGAVAARILILLCTLLFGGGAKGAVKNYIKSASNKKGGKTYYSLTLPKTVINELKDDDEYDELIEDFNDMVEDEIDDLEDDATMPKFDKITKQEKLKNSDIKHAEKYFEKMCERYDVDDDDIEITKGYEMKVKTKQKDEDGDTDHDKVTLCVVKIKGDGWKVIPMSADGLDYYD